MAASAGSAPRGSSGGGGGGSELQQLRPKSVEAANQELKTLQFKAVTAYGRLRDSVSKIGTLADTRQFRSQLTSRSETCRDLAVEFRSALASHPDRTGAATQKLVRDFQGLLRNSERLMAAAKEREAATRPVDGGSSAGVGSASTASAAAAAAAASEEEREARSKKQQETQQQQALLEAQRKQELLDTQQQLELNERVIEERDAAVREITGQIGEVHSIFRDLAVLVSDQGATLDDIESNLGAAGRHVEDARGQLVKAERSQRNSRNTWCFMLLVAAGILGVLLLIIAA